MQHVLEVANVTLCVGKRLHAHVQQLEHVDITMRMLLGCILHFCLVDKVGIYGGNALHHDEFL